MNMATINQLAGVGQRAPMAFNLADYHGPWKALCLGGYWLFNEPEQSHWTWRMLGESLAKINRFDGATNVSGYSVAQHSALAHDYAPPEHRLHALLHDAHEMVIGDKTSPVKMAERWQLKRIIQDARSSLAGLGQVDRHRLNYFISEIEEMESAMVWRIQTIILSRAGLSLPTPEEKDAIKRVDLSMLATEMRDLCSAPPAGLSIDFGGNSPYPHRIRPLEWVKAADEFLDRLSNYVKV